MLWLSHPLLPLPPCRATGEEVSGHLALPLHLDKTATVQLVSIADKHVVKVGGHLTADTDIDKVSDILSKQNTSITVAEWLILYKVNPNGSFYLFQTRQQIFFFSNDPRIIWLQLLRLYSRGEHRSYCIIYRFLTACCLLSPIHIYRLMSLRLGMCSFMDEQYVFKTHLFLMQFIFSIYPLLGSPSAGNFYVLKGHLHSRCLTLNPWPKVSDCICRTGPSVTSALKPPFMDTTVLCFCWGCFFPCFVHFCRWYNCKTLALYSVSYVSN